MLLCFFNQGKIKPQFKPVAAAQNEWKTKEEKKIGYEKICNDKSTHTESR